MDEYVRKCVGTIRQLNINIEVLCLDRGFYSKKVFTFLQDEEITHIVPVKKHSVEMKALLKENMGRFAKYTMKGNLESLKMDIAIDVQYQQEKMGSMGMSIMEEEGPPYFFPSFFVTTFLPVPNFFPLHFPLDSGQFSC